MHDSTFERHPPGDAVATGDKGSLAQGHPKLGFYSVVGHLCRPGAYRDGECAGRGKNREHLPQAEADPGGILISYPTWALVRDIVRAEERGNITAKNIRREVRVFAVAGVSG
jgi:hypothetical protein